MPVASVVVTPSSNPLVVGQTTQLKAEPRDAVGSAARRSRRAWSTSAANVASVSSTGLVTAIAPGDGDDQRHRAKERRARRASREPEAGQRRRSSHRGKSSVTVGADDAADRAGDGRHRETCWAVGRSRSPQARAAVATVSANGLVTGVAPGSATITATSEGKTGTATVTVTPIPVARSR